MAKVESRCVLVPSPSTYISLASLDIYPGTEMESLSISLSKERTDNDSFSPLLSLETKITRGIITRSKTESS